MHFVLTVFHFIQDKEPFIGERVKKLVQEGVVNALVSLSKTDSNACKELLSR